MIYLKFCGTGEGQPIQQMVLCTKQYSTAVDDVGIRVYHQPGEWERVSLHDWHNCFVMSETGRTIDKIEAP